MSVTYFERQPHHTQYVRRDAFGSGAWAFFENPSAKELGDIAQKYELNLGHLLDVRDKQEMPRLEFEDEGAYIYLRHVYTDSTGERVTAPLLMTLHHAGLFIFVSHPLAQDFEPSRAAHTLQGTTLQVVEHVLDQYGVFLGEIDHKIGSVRRNLHAHEISNADLVSFVTLGEELNEFVTSLEPLNAMLQGLLLAHHFPLTSGENELLNDLILQNQQLINAAGARMRSIESLRAAHGTISTNNLNRTMKTLTVATVLLALPNTLFTAFGTSLKLPFSDQLWVFPVLFSVVFTITLIVYAIGRKKRVF